MPLSRQDLQRALRAPEHGAPNSDSACVEKPRPHRADTCCSFAAQEASGSVRAKYQPCSARARRLTRQLCIRSTPVAPALHSAGTASAPCLAYAPSFRRPQTVETVRTARAHPEKQNTDGREASPDQDQQYGAMLRISPRTRVIARDASHGQDTAIWPRGFARPKTSAITVSTAIFRPLHYAGAPFRRSENWPTSLVTPDWSDTSPSGCVRCCRARPCTHRVAARALRSAVEESDLLAFALARRSLVAGDAVTPADPAK